MTMSRDRAIELATIFKDALEDLLRWECPEDLEIFYGELDLTDEERHFLGIPAESEEEEETDDN